jgi:hypothetical protein
VLQPDRAGLNDYCTMLCTGENLMAHWERAEDAGECGVQTEQPRRELERAIVRAKIDASKSAVGYEYARLVEHHLTQASARLALASTAPDERDEHMQVAFDHLRDVKRILGVSAVQSNTFRLFRWPFLLPGME